MQHIWSILCKSSSIDQDTNLITLRDCIEQFDITLSKKTEEKVVAPIEFEIVNLWSGNQSDKTKKFEIKTELYDPKNTKINEFLGSFIFQQNMKRMRTRMKIKGLQVTSTGTYIFKVKIKEKSQKQYKEVAELPLDITLGYK